MQARRSRTRTGLEEGVEVEEGPGLLTEIEEWASAIRVYESVADFACNHCSRLPANASDYVFYAYSLPSEVSRLGEILGIACRGLGVGCGFYSLAPRLLKVRVNTGRLTQEGLGKLRTVLELSGFRGIFLQEVEAGLLWPYLVLFKVYLPASAGRGFLEKFRKYKPPVGAYKVDFVKTPGQDMVVPRYNVRVHPEDFDELHEWKIFDEGLYRVALVLETRAMDTMALIAFNRHTAKTLEIYYRKKLEGKLQLRISESVVTPVTTTTVLTRG